MRLEGAHNGYSYMPGQPIHRRVIQSNAFYVNVYDTIEGGKGQQAIARLLLHPGCIIERTGSTIQISRDRIKLVLETDHPTQEERAWWMPDFGVRQETTCLAIHYGSVPCKADSAM
jgi:hypothetical protein